MRLSLPLLSSLLLLLMPGLMQAHEVSAVSAKAMLNSDGTWGLEMSLDVASSGNPELDDQVSPEEAAMTYLREGITVFFDDEPAEAAFTEPEVVEVGGALPSQNELTRMFTETSGIIPESAKTFRVDVSPDIEVGLIMIVFIDGQQTRRSQAIYSGESGRPIDLSFVRREVVRGDPFPDAAPDLPRVESGETPSARQAFLTGMSAAVRQLPVVALLTVALLLPLSSSGRFWGVAALFAAGVVVGSLAPLSPGPKAALWLTAMPLLLASILNFIPALPQEVRAGVSALFGLCAGIAFAAPPALAAGLAGLLTAIVLVAGLVWVVLSPFWKAENRSSNVIRAVSAILAGAAAWWMLAPLLG